MRLLQWTRLLEAHFRCSCRRSLVCIERFSKKMKISKAKDSRVSFLACRPHTIVEGCYKSKTNLGLDVFDKVMILFVVDVAVAHGVFRAMCPRGSQKNLHRPKSSLQPANSVYKSIELPLKACKVLQRV